MASISMLVANLIENNTKIIWHEQHNGEKVSSNYTNKFLGIFEATGRDLIARFSTSLLESTNDYQFSIKGISANQTQCIFSSRLRVPVETFTDTRNWPIPSHSMGTFWCIPPFPLAFCSCHTKTRTSQVNESRAYSAVFMGINQSILNYIIYI